MSDQMKDLVRLAASGKINRRAFVGRMGALGLSASVAGSMFGMVAQAQAKKGGVLRAGVQGGQSTDSLDPALAASDVPFMINMTWGETLVELEPGGVLSMRVAEEVTSNADATEWKFKIRAGMTFHNGAPVTAEDVVATLKRHTDDKAQSGAQGLVKGIAEMTAEGDTVTLKLAAANADLPFLMADYHLIIQPGGGVDNPAAGIGCGAYIVKEFEPGVRCVMEKNPTYWDTSRGFADTVEVLSINDNTARTAAITAGQIHMMTRVDPKIAEMLAGAEGVVIERAAGPGHYVFIMQCTQAPFDNNDLRMALKLAIKRDEMVEKILGGMGSVGNDFPINAAYPLFDDAIPQRAFDAAKAAEHYKASGHDGSPIVLQVAPAAFPGAVDAANLFVASANEAGIPLTIKLEPDDGYWSNVWNVAPFCASYWGGRPVQDQMYSTAYLSTADWNDTKFVDAHFDELMLAARGELDPVKRKAQYSEMANILRDTGGLICPMFNDWVEGRRAEVGGWVANPAGTLMDGKALVKCWLEA
ncbi:ABC transporter substrate-binding protein [Rhodobacter sp. KR11]|uniref:ABC transporter substrate-binding protein n=1 Tax=Rhodobacter sp. KR11 TaxID=2974588 RepID=UPI002221C938|nr:ABC transporter substrate-binding protein [Rhodobacter sp. KR11]MCW1919072.1 ABC transporter substrate-binding protein [Rhodobacter sp. KR11]